MSTLFSPLSLGKLALDNRVIIAPMCQYSADNGKTTDWHPMHLGNLAQSGAGLLSKEDYPAFSPECEACALKTLPLLHPLLLYL